MKAHVVSLLVIALAATTSAAAAPPVATGAHPPADGEIRGIVVSCWRQGYEWASPGMHDLLATFPDVGANWVSIHPYAHVSRRTGEVRWSANGRTDHMVKPSRWAHELGLKIMFKPHLAYWGEFSWRGEVGWPAGDPRWQRFHQSYHDWIVHLAQVAADEDVDLFVVGTELRQTESDTAFWTGLTKDVRAVYGGPITYASNWDDFERVGFWKELDYVGVQGYFPLARGPEPTAAAIRDGWRVPLSAMERVSRAAGRPVILTEIGYTNGSSAASEPWLSTRGEGASDLQARCLRTALEVARETAFIKGLFIWKWFPTTAPLGPGDFTVQTPELKMVITSVWRP